MESVANVEAPPAAPASPLPILKMPLTAPTPTAMPNPLPSPPHHRHPPLNPAPSGRRLRIIARLAWVLLLGSQPRHLRCLFRTDLVPPPPSLPLPCCHLCSTARANSLASPLHSIGFQCRAGGSELPPGGPSPTRPFAVLSSGFGGRHSESTVSLPLLQRAVFL